MKIIANLLLVLGLSLGAVTPARADGCYTCGSGSSGGCKDTCRFTGKDSFDKRKACERKGCKISGTGACPTAANRKVCVTSRAPSPWHGIDADDARVSTP